MDADQLFALAKQAKADFDVRFDDDDTQVRAFLLRFGRIVEQAERERCAKLCEQRSADHWHDYKDRGSPFRRDGRTEAMSDEAEECAKAIRREQR